MSNKVVLRILGTRRKMTLTNRESVKFPGQVMRDNDLQNLTLTRYAAGKKAGNTACNY